MSRKLSSTSQEGAPIQRSNQLSTFTLFISVAALLSVLTTPFISTFFGPVVPPLAEPPESVINKQSVLARCAALKAVPGLAQNSSPRDKSDRFEAGTNATWIRNGVIFTGENNGTTVIRGDLFLDKGIVKGIGKVSRRMIDNAPNLTIIDAHGAWVTPGLVDLHSHLGILSSPILSGAVDFDSTKGPILPWLRAIDSLNTHDEGYRLAVAGGVTTVQVVPGSNNPIGGEAFMVKLRKTLDGSASSMIVPPLNPNTAEADRLEPVPWRYLKQACGENPRRYGNRMDIMWALRSAYGEARSLMQSQDAYCAKAEAGLWGSVSGGFPENQKWELLVDVLRGKAKVSSYCQEAVDLDAMVRLTNEFQFPIASFHHASEGWLVPELLKRTWGGIPTLAILATNHRYKRESFRGSEYAGRVLADNGIPVAMKTDYPVLNPRYLAYEAQQAHYFGLPPHLALASITSVPAAAAGLDHRIGILTEGADADVVLWDSHPLQLGATPVKVWIDGIMQIPVPSKTGENNHVEVGNGKESDEWRRVPTVPSWDRERKDAILWDGLPPLDGNKQSRVVFTNVKKVWKKGSDGNIRETLVPGASGGTVLVEKGNIICTGENCVDVTTESNPVDLHGGSISPGLMSYGSQLGLEEIASEHSTGDGELLDAFNGNLPRILNDVGGVVRAVDALMFGTRNALTAYRSGVTLATTALAKPISLSRGHFVSGLSTTFGTGSKHAMERGAIVQDVVALHVVLGRSSPLLPKSVSVSTQIAALRRLLYGWESTDKETGIWFRKAAEGVVPLVIEVDNADIMASLLILKADVEDKIGSRMRMVFSGATEAHLLANEISKADVGVLLNPARPFPTVWDQRKILPGPPLTNDTALVTLLEHDVNVGLGVRSAWEARNLGFDIQWAILESNGRIDERKAYALVSSDLEKILGVRNVGEDADLVAYEGGGLFDLSSKVVGIISPRREVVDLF